MFSEFEKKIFVCGYFDIIDWEKDSICVRGVDIRHYWIVKKFDRKGYPGLVLYHSHDGITYHVHFCYRESDAIPAISEIMAHDRYQKKKLRQRKKITSISNQELMRAIK